MGFPWAAKNWRLRAMTEDRKLLLDTLIEICERYPHWRFGQIIVNLVQWARNPPTGDDVATAIYDIEDEELTASIRGHFERRAKLERGEPIVEDAIRT